MFRSENNFFDSERSYDNKNSVFYSPSHVRLGFLKKVYGLLAAQLSFTTFVCASTFLLPSLLDTFLFGELFTYLSIFGSIGLAFGLHFKRKEYPLNMILLGLFTLAESVVLTRLTNLFDPMLVLTALILTMITVVTLTLYTFTAKQDFNKFKAFTYSALNVIIIGSLVQIFLRSPLVDFGLTLLGIGAFSAFIIIDTDSIMKKLSPEEYIVGVISLYLDIIQLFVKILKLLQQLQNAREASERRDRKKRSN